MYAFNGLLPDIEPGKYRVIVDTNEYRNRTKQDLIAICQKCEKEINYSSIKMLNVLQPLTARIVSGIEYTKIWKCSECSYENELAETRLIQKILKDPSFLTVVPKPPTRKDGIIDRSQFHTKFTTWFWTFLTELESQAARFRQEYKGKGGEDEDFMEMIEGGESQDK